MSNIFIPNNNKPSTANGFRLDTVHTATPLPDWVSRANKLNDIKMNSNHNSLPADFSINSHANQQINSMFKNVERTQMGGAKKSRKSRKSSKRSSKRRSSSKQVRKPSKKNRKTSKKVKKTSKKSSRKAKKSSKQTGGAKKASKSKKSSKSAKKSSKKRSKLSRSLPEGLTAHRKFVEHIVQTMGIPGGPLAQTFAKIYRDMAKDKNPDLDSIALAKAATALFDKDNDANRKKLYEQAKKNLAARREETKEKKAAKKAKQAKNIV